MTHPLSAFYKNQIVQRNLVLFHDSTASIDATFVLKKEIKIKVFTRTFYNFQQVNLQKATCCIQQIPYLNLKATPECKNSILEQA